MKNVNENTQKKAIPVLFFNIGVITFNDTNNPKCNTKTPRCASGKNIFYMMYIFIPIHPSWLAFYVCCYLHGRDED
jgi:hypothetical protein